MRRRSQIPAWKRSLDLTCIFLSFPLWFPLMVVLALWVKLSSQGPVFFCQERVGFRGARFRIIKFRSMRAGAETKCHEDYVHGLMKSGLPMTKLDRLGDSRLIPLGGLIRATGLDELPQIFNVLRGEMSLVGPRPSTVVEFEKYESWHLERLNAPPGLTGSWQVNGKNRTTFDEMIALDVAYARELSLLKDVSIMLRTPIAILDQLVSRAPRAAELPPATPTITALLKPETMSGVRSSLRNARH